MFNTTAGKVLFDHKIHSADNGYGISCGDCHHTLAEDEYAEAQSCSECHDPNEGDEETPKRSDAFHSSVPAVTRNMAPVRLKKNVPPVMSCKPEKKIPAVFSAQRLNFCSTTKRVKLC